MRVLTVLSAAVLVLSGCEETLSAPESVACPPALTDFLTLTGDTVTTPEGISYIDIETGSGPIAVVGGTVEVNYSLYTETGTFVESSCPDGVPVIRFLVGGQTVLDGFQLGIIGMREGGVRRVILPVEYGYPVGHPSGLGNQVLVFDIHFHDLL